VATFNLTAHPDEVRIQDGPEVFDVTVREVEGDEQNEWWARAVEAYPPYAEYQAATERRIPVFVATRKS
jgi:F420H(2)-dependent quinone reductase